MLHNFTYIQEHLVSWSMQGYETVLGGFVYPLIFTAIIGYVYLKQQSAVAASIGILIILAAFGPILINYAAGVAIWVTIMEIIVFLSITALVLIFFTKWRNR